MLDAMGALFRRRGLGWMAIGPILLAIGLYGMLYQPLVRIPKERALELRGVETEGEIVELYERRRVTGGRKRPAKGARIAFTTVSGERISFSKSVGRDFYFAHEVGDPIRVVYDAENPNVFEAAFGDRASAEATFWIMTAMSAAGLILTFVFWPFRRR